MESIQDMLVEIGAHLLLLYKVKKNFCTFTSFSDAFIPISPVEVEDYTRLSLEFKTLFELKEVAANLPENVKTFLGREIQWSKLDKKMSEKHILVHLASKLLVPLFGKVTFESGYIPLVKGLEGMETSKIGIGSKYTLHGTPDLRLEGLLFVTTEDEDEEEEGEVEASLSSAIDSSGVSSGADKNEGYKYVEGERCIADRDLHKLVATTVTCSFTNHNNHLDLNPLSPTLLLNSKSFRVCMYDCVHDILLLSQPIDLFKVVKSGRKILAPSACLLLWIVVNHRKFLSRLDDPSFTASYQSTILQRIKDDGALSHYKAITNYDIFFPGGAQSVNTNPIKLIEVNVLPPSKKARTA